MQIVMIDFRAKLLKGDFLAGFDDLWQIRVAMVHEGRAGFLKFDCVPSHKDWTMLCEGKP